MPSHARARWAAPQHPAPAGAMRWRFSRPWRVVWPGRREPEHRMPTGSGAESRAVRVRCDGLAGVVPRARRLARRRDASHRSWCAVTARTDSDACAPRRARNIATHVGHACCTVTPRRRYDAVNAACLRSGDRGARGILGWAHRSWSSHHALVYIKRCD